MDGSDSSFGGLGRKLYSWPMDLDGREYEMLMIKYVIVDCEHGQSQALDAREGEEGAEGQGTLGIPTCTIQSTLLRAAV